MSGLRHHNRGKRAGRFLLGATATVALISGLWLTSSLAACGIGLEGEDTSTASGFDDADAGLSADAAAVALTTGDAGKIVALMPQVDSGYTNTGSGSGSSVSPLCGVNPTTCEPDDGVCTGPTAVGTNDASVAVDAAIGALFDAGTLAFDAGAAVAEAFSCHVTAVAGEAGQVAVPVCSASGRGKAESTCSASSECGAGLECVMDDAKAAADGALPVGVCRRYCCDNTCADPASYCDIETTVTASVTVPVCAPRPTHNGSDGGASCTLLDDATCAAPQLSCQVVDSSGDVACVNAGTATAGESCETTKCARGLSCVLGYFPERTCAQLCKLDNDQCPVGQKCTESETVSVSNPAVGVCASSS